MQGEQLPKATMNAFIKKHTKMTFNKEFLEKMLLLAKEFIITVSDKCNNVCQSNGKKTINVQHLEIALTELGIIQNLQSLRNVEKNLKEMNQLKKEENLRIEERLAEDREEQMKKRRQEENARKQMATRQKFDEIEKQEQNQAVDCDYENLEKGQSEKETHKQ